MEKDGLLTLAETNKGLVAQLVELATLKDELWTLRNKVHPIEKALRTTEVELQEALAEKSALEQEMQLARAQRSSKRREWLVAGLPKLVCFFSLMAGMPLFMLSIFNVVPMQAFPIIWCSIGCVMMWLNMSMRATDVMAIRCLNVLMVFMSVVGQLMNFPPLLLMFYFVDLPEDHLTRNATGISTLHQPFSSMKVDIAIIIVFMGVCSILFFRLKMHLKTHDGQRMPWTPSKALKKWTKSRYGPFRGGLLVNQWPMVAWAIQQQLAGNFTTAPRIVLMSFLNLFRYMMVGMVGGIAILQAVRIALEQHNFSPAESFFHFSMFYSCVSGVFVFPLLLTPYVRNKYHSFLSSLAVRGEAGRAAGVAALIGKRDVKTVLAQARRSFQGVPFNRLVEGHFATNAADAASMHGLPMRCQLGQVDAFLSHSWHDDPSSKWATLSMWAKEFEGSMGRPPILWFDKACLNQDDIEAQLASLPVFLAGSRALLCLVGLTYTERIWCVVEIFTFLRMGGTQDKLMVRPVRETRAAVLENALEDGGSAWAQASDEELLSLSLEKFRSFDVGQCKCFDENQLQHLLGVIEAGFSSFEMFNSLVRHAFVDKLEDILSKAGGPTSSSYRFGEGGGPPLSERSRGGGGGGAPALGKNSSRAWLPVSPAPVAPAAMMKKETAPSSNGHADEVMAVDDVIDSVA